MKIGGLFFGYGGLDLAVQQVLGGELAWVSEIDKGACKIIEHRFPGVPNLGDITKIQWVPTCGAYEFEGCGQPAEVLPDRSGWQCNHCQKLWPISLGKVYWPEIPEPVDVLTGGSPCQDLSHAGKRAGMTEGTRSNLWVAMREAIAVLRPSLVVWENVRGAYSAAADSAVEPCPGCVGDGSGVHLRALGRVLGDLADLGYDAQWHGLRAADFGAPHGRFRVFVTAYARDRAGHGKWTRPEPRQGGEAASFPADLRHERGGASRDGWAGPADSHRGDVTLLGTPRASEWKGSGPVGSKSHAHMEAREYLSAQVLSLLPTPAVNDMGEGKTVEQWDTWTDAMKAKHGNGNGHGASLAIEAQRLLPTPNASDVAKGGSQHPDKRRAGGHQPTITDVVEHQLLPTPSGYAGQRGGSQHPDKLRAAGHSVHVADVVEHVSKREWGQYTEAIRRWEGITRPAPPPTEPSAKGNPRLSARFSEWLMGLPDGWITDVPGITRNEALKACGNGVVPQQAAAALRIMLARAEALP